MPPLSSMKHPHIMHIPSAVVIKNLRKDNESSPLYTYDDISNLRQYMVRIHPDAYVHASLFSLCKRDKCILTCSVLKQRKRKKNGHMVLAHE